MIDLMILYVLLKHDLTMYAIHKRIQENFLAYTSPSFGAIKPSLVRLEKQGCISSSKIMSDGGKLSVYYSITKEGLRELKALLLKPLSSNPLQFLSDARVKLSCISFLDKESSEEVFENIKSNALMHKVNAEKILADEYTPLTFHQRIVLDNTICEYKNFISMVEGLEKDNAGNSK
ncbi:PadR family transcriptional regulator [bacterium]|nr:PadR family transcriptional regulator [bacterium]